jgi:hypothetical protein
MAANGLAMHSNFNDLKNRTMTAKEFIEKEALEYKLAEYDEGGFVGIDERLLEQKLEEYHQAKLKLLGIDVVVGQSEQLPCGDLIKHNFSLCKIGRCITCDRAKEKAR